jgi:RNA polymerase sigma factor (sigma-70 family)
MITRAEETARKVTQKIETGNPEVLHRLRRMIVAVNGAVDPDLEQDVFLRVLEAFRQRPRVQSPFGLMRKIVHDTIVDSWRARGKAPSGDPGGLGESTLVETPRIEERLDRERDLRRLEESILNLGCDIRGPVYLYYVEEYPIRTIVRIFGKSPSAVKMALHRGRRQLGKMFRNPARRTTKKVGPSARTDLPRLPTH